VLLSLLSFIYALSNVFVADFIRVELLDFTGSLSREADGVQDDKIETEALAEKTYSAAVEAALGQSREMWPSWPQL